MNFKELFEKVRNITSKQVPQDDDMIMPTLALLKGEYTTFIALAGVEPRHVLPMILAKEKPECYVLACEVRMKRSTEEDPVIPGERFAHRTEYPEYLMIAGSENGGEFLVEQAEIIDRQLEDWKVMEFEGISGALVVTEW
jgi:hypothetical protein